MGKTIDLSDLVTSIVVGASSIGHHMSVGQSIGKSVVGIGVGEDTGGGVGEGRVSLGLSAGRGSEGYHQLNTDIQLGKFLSSSGSNMKGKVKTRP